MWLTKAHTSQEAPTSISGSSSLFKQYFGRKTLKVGLTVAYVREEFEKLL